MMVVMTTMLFITVRRLRAMESESIGPGLGGASNPASTISPSRGWQCSRELCLAHQAWGREHFQTIVSRHQHHRRRSHRIHRFIVIIGIIVIVKVVILVIVIIGTMAFLVNGHDEADGGHDDGKIYGDGDPDETKMGSLMANVEDMGCSGW